MNRVALSAGRPVAVAIVFLCMLALTFCQVLGPTARLNHAFGPADLSDPVIAATSEHISGAHNPLPSRCASIKLAPVEIRAADFAPTEVACGLIPTVTSTSPQSAELSVPTPPPRQG